MAEIRFSIDGDVQLARNLRVFVQQLQNMEDFYQSALEAMADRSDRIFKAQGSNLQNAPSWRGLSSRTLLARTKRWGYYKKAPNGPGILRWTGTLQEDKEITVTNQFGQLAFTAPYAYYHQQGAGRLPKRAMLDLDMATNAEIVRLLQKKINDDIGISGLQA